MEGTLVITAMRNEGPFILEWLAWYRMLGFQHALVMHNDCTDHSPQLLRLLERHGFLAQKSHEPDPARPPQPQAHIKARRHPLVQAAEWAFVCDADEFLVIHKGDGSIGALVDNGNLQAAGVIVNWSIFGSSGRARYEDGLVHRQFLHSAKTFASQNNGIKTVIRRPRDFGRLRAHGPRGWRGAGRWGEGENVFLLADGRPYPEYDPDPVGTHPINGTVKNVVVHDWAQLNHYAVRSHEQYAFKKGRASAALLEDRYTDDFFQRFDRNEIENESALAYRDRFDAAYGELVAVPGALRLHHLCCADYVAAMCEKRGDDPKRDPRYVMHRDAAASLPKHEKPSG